MFCDCSGLTSLTFSSSFDTASVKDMSCMFCGCSSLTTLVLSSFDTSEVINMYGMFDSCVSLTELDLSSFDTSKVTNMGYMFSGCHGLTSLNLSSFDTTKVTNALNMFLQCIDLNEIVTPTIIGSTALPLYGNFWNGTEDIEEITSADASTSTQLKTIYSHDGHTLRAAIEQNKTCTEDGVSAHDHCTVCNKNFIDGVEQSDEDLKIPAGHEWATEWSYDENMHWHEAICEHSTEKGDEDGHNFENGVCTVCGICNKNTIENLTINGIDCTATNKIGIHFDYVFDCDDGNFSFYTVRGTNDFFLNFSIPEGADFTINSSSVSLPYALIVEDGEMSEITVNVKSELDLIGGGEGKTYVIKVYVAEILHGLDDLKIYVSETDLTDVLDVLGDPLFFGVNTSLGTMVLPFKTKSAYFLPIANNFSGKIKIGTETLDCISDGLVKEFSVGDNLIEICVFSELEALAAGDEKNRR